MRRKYLLRLLYFLSEGDKTEYELIKLTNGREVTIRRLLSKLCNSGAVEKYKKNGKTYYRLKEKIDIPLPKLDVVRVMFCVEDFKKLGAKCPIDGKQCPCDDFLLRLECKAKIFKPLIAI